MPDAAENPPPTFVLPVIPTPPDTTSEPAPVLVPTAAAVLVMTTLPATPTPPATVSAPDPVEVAVTVAGSLRTTAPVCPFTVTAPAAAENPPPTFVLPAIPTPPETTSEPVPVPTAAAVLVTTTLPATPTPPATVSAPEPVEVADTVAGSFRTTAPVCPFTVTLPAAAENPPPTLVLPAIPTPPDTMRAPAPVPVPTAAAVLVTTTLPPIPTPPATVSAPEPVTVAVTVAGSLRTTAPV